MLDPTLPLPRARSHLTHINNCIKYHLFAGAACNILNIKLKSSPLMKPSLKNQLQNQCHRCGSCRESVLRAIYIHPKYDFDMNLAILNPDKVKNSHRSASTGIGVKRYSVLCRKGSVL